MLSRSWAGRLRTWSVAVVVVAVYVASSLTTLAEATTCPVGADINGTSGEDYLVAPDNEQNLIRGFDGADFIRGKDCDDDLYGGKGPDNVHGAYGLDDIFGDDGNDNPNNCNLTFTYCGELVGGAHSDAISGGANWDKLDDTATGDVLDIAQGDGGDDNINVKDGAADDVQAAAAAPIHAQLTTDRRRTGHASSCAPSPSVDY